MRKWPGAVAEILSSSNFKIRAINDLGMNKSHIEQNAYYPSLVHFKYIKKL